MLASEDCGIVMPGVLSYWRSHHAKRAAKLRRILAGNLTSTHFFPLARIKSHCVTVLWRPTFFHWLLRGYVVTIKSHKNTELLTRTQSASRTERMMSPQREATQIRKQSSQYTKSYHTTGKSRAQQYVRFKESRWYRDCAGFSQEVFKHCLFKSFSSSAEI